MKKTMSLLLTLLLLLSLTVPAAAAGPDLQKKGSVTIHLSYQRDPTASAEGAVFRLYRVGDVVDQNANLQFQLNSDFAGSNLSVNDLRTPGLAMQLVAYAKAEKLRGPEKTTDAGGKAEFTDLPMGLYLAEQVASPKGYLPADPFLVSLPWYDEARDRWEYDVLAEPKYMPAPTQKPREITLRVRKIWAEPGDHPAEIRVHLLQGTEPRDTVVLSGKNQWEHRWTGLDGDQNWSVAEQVPEGYRPLYIREGDTVLVVNSRQPEQPPAKKPPLIQTGQLNWPIPLLASGGLILIGAGLILRRKKKEE